MEDFPHLTQSVAEVLKELLERKSITTAQLARDAGMDRLYLHHLLAGKHQLTLNAVFTICRGLDMSAAKFVEMVEERVKG